MGKTLISSFYLIILFFIWFAQKEINSLDLNKINNSDTDEVININKKRF